MQITLNQIIREIKLFAKSHGQINDVAFCDPSDWLADRDKTYPALFFYYTRGRKQANELVLSFSVWVADRITPEKHNEAEVWSDTLSISCDLLAYLDRNDAPYTLQEGAEFVPFTSTSADLLTGHQANIVLRVDYPYNRCDIPQKPAGDDPLLITNEGNYIITSNGQRIVVQLTPDGLVLVTEGGGKVITDDGQQLIVQNTL